MLKVATGVGGGDCGDGYSQCFHKLHCLWLWYLWGDARNLQNWRAV